jgi:hypothetical protein
MRRRRSRGTTTNDRRPTGRKRLGGRLFRYIRKTVVDFGEEGPQGRFAFAGVDRFPVAGTPRVRRTAAIRRAVAGVPTRRQVVAGYNGTKSWRLCRTAANLRAVQPADQRAPAMSGSVGQAVVDVSTAGKAVVWTSAPSGMSIVWIGSFSRTLHPYVDRCLDLFKAHVVCSPVEFVTFVRSARTGITRNPRQCPRPFAAHVAQPEPRLALVAVLDQAHHDDDRGRPREARQLLSALQSMPPVVT